MKYTVARKPSAESQLADIWSGSADRAAVTQAANEIDRRLEQDPQLQGEARSGKRRVLIVAPLAVFFEVREPDRVVAVLRVLPLARAH